VHLVPAIDDAIMLRRRALARAQGRRRLTLLLGAVGIVAALVGYKVLQMSSTFAVTGVEVEGASPSLSRDIEQAVKGDALGRSLLETDAATIEAQVEQLPYVRDAWVDRAFPHTLRVHIEPYRPAAVVTAGPAAYLIADDARVLAEVGKPPKKLPMIRIPVGTALVIGDRATDANVHAALTVMATADEEFRRRVGKITALIPRAGEITAVVGKHIQLRFGPPDQLDVKMAVAERVMRRIEGQERTDISYLDVSAPARPALGLRDASASTTT
jgi:cell division protein FtsQ